MKLGLKKDEVRLSDYTHEWSEEFIRVKKEIMENTNIEENRIEHIGSTAIKDMLAKPILDILVAVDDLTQIDKTILSGLKHIGFLRLKVDRPGEIVFAKFTDGTYEEKTHFIHLVEYQKGLWNDLLFFRDYLNSNEIARKQYMEIKLEYLKKSTTGINEYTNHKEEFVKNILMQRKKFIIEEKDGYTSSIGRLLSMMEFTRMTTLESVNGLTAEELDYRIDGKGNSIGCLLYHMACVEEVYQIMTFEERDPNEKELKKLEIGLNIGERAHQEIYNKDIKFYKEQLHRVRERTLERFRYKEDSWLDKISHFGPNHKANNYFRWFHVFEDELNHRGQIRLIFKHMKRKQEG